MQRAQRNPIARLKMELASAGRRARSRLVTALTPMSVSNVNTDVMVTTVTNSP